MPSNYSKFRWFSLLLAAAFIFMGCKVFNVAVGGDIVTETISIEPQGAASLSVLIEMDLGELKLHGMGNSLLQGSYAYNVPDWKPSTVYEVAGDKGVLRITQPGSDTNLTNDPVNTWDLGLSEGIPMAIEINLGAVMSDIDLSRIDVTSLRVSTGAGDLNLDLRGAWEHDLDIIINHGLGEITLQLPQDMGVRVDVNKGVGEVNASGLEQVGSVYTNSLYGESAPRLNIQIESGAGDITLEG